MEAEALRPAGLHRGRRFQSGPVGGEVGAPGLKPGEGWTMTQGKRIDRWIRRGLARFLRPLLEVIKTASRF